MVQQHAGSAAGKPPAQARRPMMARIRSKGVEVGEIAVLDLSLAGCMVGTGLWRAREDQRVLVSLPNVPSLPGHVIWVENGRAGILFDQLLNEVVYEHLCGSFALQSEA